MSDPTVTPAELLCQRCGHSLGGLRAEQRCPQCELTVEQSIAGGGWQPALDEYGAVLTDLPCDRCGYNLHSLQEDGNCPECGLSVGSSTRGHFLCRSDPNWVRGIAIGCSMTYVSMALAVLAALAAFVTARLPFPSSMVAGIFALFIPGAMLLGCVAVWIITGREHGWHVADRIRRNRGWARVGLAVATCLPIAAAAVTSTASGGFSIVHWCILLLVICGGFTIGLPNYFAYVRYLCVRIPNQRLAERAETLRTACPLSVVALSVCIAALVVIDAQGGTLPDFGPLIAVITSIAGAVTVVFLCTACVFHFRLSRLLHGQVDAARSNARAMER